MKNHLTILVDVCLIFVHWKGVVNYTPLFLYPPHRGYISFVNTFVTPRNNDLGHFVPWRQRKILRHLSYVCLSVRPSVVNTTASEHKELQTSKFAHRLLLPIRWLVLKMGYIGPQGPVPPIQVKSVNWGLEHIERPIHTKFDI